MRLGDWDLDLCLTIHFIVQINFKFISILCSPILSHLYIICCIRCVLQYCMYRYSTCVQYVMSLLVPAWWHWSGCRGSSCRSRSQGSLGSSQHRSSEQRRGWELWARSEPSNASPDQGHCTTPHQPASTPATTSSLYYNRKYKFNIKLRFKLNLALCSFTM